MICVKSYPVHSEQINSSQDTPGHQHVLYHGTCQSRRRWKEINEDADDSVSSSSHGVLSLKAATTSRNLAHGNPSLSQ